MVVSFKGAHFPQVRIPVESETVAELPGLVWLLKGICGIVLASTCEHGGHSYVRSGGVSTRSQRGGD